MAETEQSRDRTIEGIGDPGTARGEDNTAARVWDSLDLYILYRMADAARFPPLADWVVRHRVTAGFRIGHAARHRHVLIVGTAEGLDLPSNCRVRHLNPGAVKHALATDPLPADLFAVAAS